MEEVLKRIYNKNPRNIQRKRIQKALDAQSYIQRERKKYDFREDTTIATPQPNLPFQDQIRFEKDLLQTGRRNFLGVSSISPHHQQFRLPIITKKQKPKLLRRKFRGAVWSIVFLNRIQMKIKQSMLKRKRRAQKCYKNLLVFVEKLVRGYYQKQLKDQLNNYINILQNKIDHPKIDQQKEVVQMLYYISQKLSVSTITKDLLEFFVQSSVSNSFSPTDFLSNMEIIRLQFSVKYGCLIDVSHQQTRMLIGLGLGVKIFCFYILNQPWKLGMATDKIINNIKQLKDQISNITSVFNFIILQQFCYKLKEIRTLNKSLLNNFSIRPISQLDPYGQQIKQPNTNRQIILNQNRNYLSKLQLNFPQICRDIKSNLIKWISRISYACIKQSQRKDRKRQQSIYYRTIDKKEDSIDKKVYQSLQITKKKKDKQNPYGTIKYYAQSNPPPLPTIMSPPISSINPFLQ